MRKGNGTCKRWSANDVKIKNLAGTEGVARHSQHFVDKVPLWRDKVGRERPELGKKTQRGNSACVIQSCGNARGSADCSNICRPLRPLFAGNVPLERGGSRPEHKS